MTNAEIQVGEYVKTKEGYIAKCTKKRDYILTFDNTVKTSYGDPWDCLFPENHDITKHSFNLIDLIEVGDYVNGSFIIRAAKDCVDDEGIPIILAENYDEWTDDGIIYNEDIKTIVTKEQFKAMEYKVGGEND